jgi:hypothetical protein
MILAPFSAAMPAISTALSMLRPESAAVLICMAAIFISYYGSSLYCLPLFSKEGLGEI